MRLLFFAGSTREGSYNKKLARLAQHIATANGIEGVFVDSKNYPMPLYNATSRPSRDRRRRPRSSRRCSPSIRACSSQAPSTTLPVTPLLKNTIDWVTRVRAKGETGLEVYKTRVFAIGGASPGYYGAMRSLLNLRQFSQSASALR